MTAIHVRLLLSTICLIVFSAPLMLSEERDAQRPANGNNLIRPLADLEKDLKGKLERIQVHGNSLEGNLEGDSPDRDVFVYLPPSCDPPAACWTRARSRRQ